MFIWTISDVLTLIGLACFLLVGLLVAGQYYFDKLKRKLRR